MSFELDPTQPVNVKAASRDAMSKLYGLTGLLRDMNGTPFASRAVPLSDYARWFSTYSRLPLDHVQKHPQFWDTALMRLFLSSPDAASFLNDPARQDDT